jgi:hypothetical protein
MAPFMGLTTHRVMKGGGTAPRIHLGTRCRRPGGKTPSSLGDCEETRPLLAARAVMRSRRFSHRFVASDIRWGRPQLRGVMRAVRQISIGGASLDLHAARSIANFRRRRRTGRRNDETKNYLFFIFFSSRHIRAGQDITGISAVGSYSGIIRFGRTTAVKT